MAGRKRAAEETTTEKRETRSAKVAKTEGTKGAGRGAKGTARLKTSMPASTFKSRALPLHVNITHTPPTVAEGEESVAHADPGFVGSTTLVPTSFATGSFGWKGSKRMVVELPKAEGQEGESEKLNVMWTINATVIGSKDVKDGGEEHEGEAEGAHHEAHHEEAAGESAESKPEESSEAKEAGEKPTVEEGGATST